MILSEQEQQLANEARAYIKEHRQEIVAKFVTGVESVDTLCLFLWLGHPGQVKQNFLRTY